MTTREKYEALRLLTLASVNDREAFESMMAELKKAGEELTKE